MILPKLTPKNCEEYTLLLVRTRGFAQRQAAAICSEIPVSCPHKIQTSLKHCYQYQNRRNMSLKILFWMPTAVRHDLSHLCLILWMQVNIKKCNYSWEACAWTWEHLGFLNSYDLLAWPWWRFLYICQPINRHFILCNFSHIIDRM